MVVKDILLRLGKNKRSKTTEQFRDCIEAFYSERSSRVATMSSCKTSWEDSPQSRIVSRDSGEDVGEIAMDRSPNANMLSFTTERDFLVAKAHWRYKLPIICRCFQACRSKAE